MTAVMKGVRILEVAEHTFVPAASALLSDWGAEVIKIEHVERGDAMRGLAASSGVVVMPTNVHVLLEHSNRGKKSLALDLTTDEGLDILAKLIATSDVFLTNKLPGVRAKLQHRGRRRPGAQPAASSTCGARVRAQRGPDADKGSYDSLAFWCRPGIALGRQAPRLRPRAQPARPRLRRLDRRHDHRRRDHGRALPPRTHRRGDHRRRVAVRHRALGDGPGGGVVAADGRSDDGAAAQTGSGGNPLVANYVTKDGRFLSFTCLQAGKYWPPMCEVIERPELATDPRFADHAALMANGPEAGEILPRRVRRADPRRLARAPRRLHRPVDGRAGHARGGGRSADPWPTATCRTARPPTASPFQLVAAPVQFNEEPAPAGRAPEFNEHGDAILTDLGLDWDTILDLKVRGITA